MPLPKADVAPGSEQYSTLATQTEQNLQQQILQQWFPRAVDPQGGFLQNFNNEWHPLGDQSKGVVYQSRLTWIAAKAFARYPSQQQWKTWSDHGVEYLAKRLWDSKQGGFHWTVRQDDIPARRKRTYGVAFAIHALAANFQMTHNPPTLELARQAFTWLETYAHDKVHGGYFETLSAENQPGPDPRLSRGDQKSMNTHIHVLEAFTALSEVWRDALLKKRLEEVFQLVSDKVVDAGGFQHLFLSRDWTPIPGRDSYGHDIETAFLLVDAATALGMPDDPKTWRLARALVDHTLAVGIDQEFGGVYREGSATEAPTDGLGTMKDWWAQAEALNALLMAHERFSHQTAGYWHAFQDLWRFISDRQVDHQHKGWFRCLQRDGRPLPGEVKSNEWTEGYHQGRAMMNATDRLKRLATR